MKLSWLLAFALFLLINYMAVSEDVSVFIDPASVLIVLGGAIPFALCGNGSWLSVSRLGNAAEGAVIAGWLGALYGSVIILGNIDEQSIEWMGPACAVMALTVVYGYFVKALCRMAILAQEAD